MLWAVLGNAPGLRCCRRHYRLEGHPMSTTWAPHILIACTRLLSGTAAGTTMTSGSSRYPGGAAPCRDGSPEGPPLMREYLPLDSQAAGPPARCAEPARRA